MLSPRFAVMNAMKSLSKWRSCDQININKSSSKVEPVHLTTFSLPDLSTNKTSKEPEIFTLCKMVSLNEKLSTDEKKVKVVDDNKTMTNSPRLPVTRASKVISIILFGWSSFSLLLINKIIFTAFKFDWYYFLATAQSAFTLLGITGLHLTGLIKVQRMSFKVFMRLFPIQILFLCGLVTGFAATKHLNVPMFTTIRRLGVPIALALEYLMLKTSMESYKLISVTIIIAGTVVAVSHDFYFTFKGYLFAIAYNFATALELIYIKRRLAEIEGMTSLMLLIYSYICSLPLLVIACFVTGEFSAALKYSHWDNKIFVLLFVTDLLFGALIGYTAILCNEYNSPVIVSIVSNIKNIALTYAGVFMGLDYVFNWYNFAGINICLSGSLTYTYFSITKVKSGNDLKESTSKKAEDDKSSIEGQSKTITGDESVVISENGLQMVEWGGSLPTLKVACEVNGDHQERKAS